MPNLTPTSSFDDVPELETDTLALGGPGGPMNLPAQALLNRTQWLKDNAVAGSSSPYAVGTGTANACAAAYTPAITALVDGMKLRFLAAATNTGATTFAPDALTAQPIVGGAYAALQGGEILADGEVELTWNAALTSWVITAQAGGSPQVPDATKSKQAASKAQVDQITTDLASTATGKGAALVGWPSGFGINQPSTGLFFSSNGAAIQRLSDRVFVGGATVNDGAFPDVTQDWLSIYQHTLTAFGGGGVAPAVRSSQLAVLTNTYSASAESFVSGSQTKYFSSSAASSIGVSGYALANHATLSAKAWAYYGEAHRVVDNGAGTYGMELDVFTVSVSGVPTPYTQGDVIGLQLGAGAGITGGQDASAAIQIVGNHQKWNVGINFYSDAIVGTDGVTGTGTAIALARGHALRWYGTGGVETSSVYSSGTTSANAVQVNLSDGYFRIQNKSTTTLQHLFSVSDTAVNYLAYSSANAGFAPQIAVGGTDTNIDLALIPKGAGNIRFGTYAASVLSVTGYITIKDQGGTLRRLLVG